MIAKLAELIKVTITNILPEAEYVYSNTGKRTVMSLAEAKEMKITDFEFLLNAQGNFMKIVDGVAVDYAEGEEVNKDDNAAVIARVAAKATDRYVQFFATQQKVLLAPGDSLEFNVKTAAEAAHYMALAVDGEITVVVEGVTEE